MTKDFTIIKCPKCGYEYCAGEIFFPDDLLGHPDNIIRDDDGHIILIEGKQPILEETFECDKCGTTFRARIGIQSETRYNKDFDGEDFVIDLKDQDKEELF